MTTEQDYADAAAWAENEMTLRSGSTTALRGGDAAAYGAAVLATATSNDPAVVMPSRTGGRPSLDPTAAPGEHAKVRQVRLPAATNTALDAQATAEGRSVSQVLRDAVTEYLTTHRAG